MIRWHELTAIVPTADEVARHAPALAAAYNDPRNATLLGNTQPLTEADVVEHYGAVAYPFVFLQDGELAGEEGYRRIQRDHMRLHRQYGMPNGLRHRYDYYLAAFGPLALADRVRLGAAVPALFGEDGEFRASSGPPPA